MDPKNYVLGVCKERLKDCLDDLNDSSTINSIIKRFEFVREEMDQAIEMLNAVSMVKGLNIMATDEGIELKF